MAMRESRKEKIFHWINAMAMVLLIIVMVYPFWYVIMYSLSKPYLAINGGFFLLPKGFTLEAYKTVLRNRSIITGFITSAVATVGGASLGTILAAMTAYSLSKKNMPGRKLLTYVFFFTMFFGGGLVPEYLLYKQFRLLDTYWVLFLPGCLSVWNILVIKNFYKSIPDSLEESAKIDGASEISVFFRIIIPLSKPVMATYNSFISGGTLLE